MMNAAQDLGVSANIARYHEAPDPAKRCGLSSSIDGYELMNLHAKNPRRKRIGHQAAAAGGNR
jgi:hypothetical protein